MTAIKIFSRELRLARSAKGLSQTALAEQIAYSAQLVSKVELADRRPSADFARRCDQVLDTGGLLERIQEEIGDDVFLEWFREWAGIEREAAVLRWFEPLCVPGLLQTEMYAHAVLVSGGLIPAEEVGQQVAARLTRQEVLHRKRPPIFMAVIDETALRRPVGGAAVMREQLAQLRKLSELPRVRIQVVPATAGAYAGLGGHFVIATPEHGSEVAYLEAPIHGHVTDRPKELAVLIQTWESIRGMALSESQSIELIAEVEQSWS